MIHDHQLNGEGWGHTFELRCSLSFSRKFWSGRTHSRFHRRYAQHRLRVGDLVPCTRSIDDYHGDFLKTALKAVIGRTWTDEPDAIRSATRHLGFRRTGPKIERAFKSAINDLLRQNELERNGRNLRRPIQ